MRLASKIDLTKGDPQVRYYLLYDGRYQRALKLAYKAGYKAAEQDAATSHRRTLPRQRVRAERDRAMFPRYMAPPVTPASWERLPLPDSRGRA
jgi:hypothetical protein